MNKEEKIKLLIEKHNFNEGTALAYVESEGRCIYCGTELLENLLSYFSADIDHLLPKSTYPEQKNNIHNWVLSCHTCNLLKGKIDIGELHGLLNKF